MEMTVWDQSVFETIMRCDHTFINQKKTATLDRLENMATSQCGKMKYNKKNLSTLLHFKSV